MEILCLNPLLAWNIMPILDDSPKSFKVFNVTFIDPFIFLSITHYTLIISAYHHYPPTLSSVFHTTAPLNLMSFSFPLLITPWVQVVLPICAWVCIHSHVLKGGKSVWFVCEQCAFRSSHTLVNFGQNNKNILQNWLKYFPLPWCARSLPYWVYLGVSVYDGECVAEGNRSQHGVQEVDQAPSSSNQALSPPQYSTQILNSLVRSESSWPSHL